MRSYQRMNRAGFTIVELLVVIVVIAILAAITIVAYSGLRERAANARSVAAVNQMEKGLILIKSDTGAPLQADRADMDAAGISTEYYTSYFNMSGACLGGSWPSEEQMVDDLNTDQARTIYANNRPDLYREYCGIWGNGAWTQSTIISVFRRSLTKIGHTSSLPNMPSTEPITVETKDNTSYTFRGLRYAFNGSLTSPVSYIYYPVYGKACPVGDTSIRLGATIIPGVAPGAYFSGFDSADLGGDYTANNTQYCVRTVKY